MRYQNSLKLEIPSFSRIQRTKFCQTSSCCVLSVPD